MLLVGKNSVHSVFLGFDPLPPLFFKAFDVSNDILRGWTHFLSCECAVTYSHNGTASSSLT